MKIIYECEYCQVKYHDIEWMKEHEKDCVKNPLNFLCFSCIKHIYFLGPNANGHGRITGCTRFGLDCDVREKCSYYIKDDRQS